MSGGYLADDVRGFEPADGLEILGHGTIKVAFAVEVISVFSEDFNNGRVVILSRVCQVDGHKVQIFLEELSKKGRGSKNGGSGNVDRERATYHVELGRGILLLQLEDLPVACHNENGTPLADNMGHVIDDPAPANELVLEVIHIHAVHPAHLGGRA